MKAVILTGGEGTRLRPLTCTTPKAMVPILNRPFMEYLLLYLKKHGITDIVLAMGYLPDKIQNQLGNGTQLGVQLTYLVEHSPLGTAGAVKNAESFLDQTFLVFNGDILTDIDLTAIMNQHREKGARASIVLTPVDNPTIYGIVETDANGKIRSFVEKPSWDRVITNMINAGIYILEPEVMGYVPPATPWMFECNLFPLLLEKNEPMFGFPSGGYWIDIGTPEKYMQAHHDLLMRWDKPEVRTEGQCQIHPTAKITGNTLIGEGCTIAANVQIKAPAVLGPKCQIGESTLIEGAVLWGGSQVAEETIIRNCVVGSCGCIESNCDIAENCILGDNVRVSQGTKLASGEKIWPDSYVNPDNGTD